MTIIVVRPNITYRASTAILCKAGSELGVTCHGHHDFQLQDDALHKVHVGHYTFYSKAVVKHPKLMIRAPGVFAREYIRGEDIKDIQQLGKVALDLQPLDVMHLNELTGNDGGDDTDLESDLPEGSLYSSTSTYYDSTDPRNNYYIRGTCYITDGADRKVVSKVINSYGFGESTYPGCRYAREGHGMCLKGVERTLESMI